MDISKRLPFGYSNCDYADKKSRTPSLLRGGARYPPRHQHSVPGFCRKPDSGFPTGRFAAVRNLKSFSSAVERYVDRSPRRMECRKGSDTVVQCAEENGRMCAENCLRLTKR